METTNSYTQAAELFAKKHGIKLTTTWERYGLHFHSDKQSRDIFKCKLTRAGKSYTFSFGQSIVEGNTPPDIYSVLACLTKYDPETFEHFCANYGYDTDSRTAEKVYRAVVKEYAAVTRLFGDILEELQEIN